MVSSSSSSSLLNHISPQNQKSSWINLNTFVPVGTTYKIWPWSVLCKKKICDATRHASEIWQWCRERKSSLVTGPAKSVVHAWFLDCKMLGSKIFKFPTSMGVSEMRCFPVLLSMVVEIGGSVNVARNLRAIWELLKRMRVKRTGNAIDLADGTSNLASTSPTSRFWSPPFAPPWCVHWRLFIFLELVQICADQQAKHKTAYYLLDFSISRKFLGTFRIWIYVLYTPIFRYKLIVYNTYRYMLFSICSLCSNTPAFDSQSK